MPAHGTSQELNLLVDLLNQSYDKKAWHGPNLRGAIVRLDAASAGWRPLPGRHNIAEHVVHAAYWKYANRRRLLGGRRGSFALKGSNWFKLADSMTESQWKDHRDLLDGEHELLLAAVDAFRPAALHEYLGGKTFTAAALIYGAACHDIYHAGQIQLLKRLYAEQHPSAGRKRR